MKPEQLKSPFTWEKRKVLLQDRVLFIPDCLESYKAADIPSWQVIFGNENPLHVEYCSGNGSWIANKALQNPQINWIAVELKFERVRKIWSKIKNHQIPNLLVICGKAEWATTHFFNGASIAEMYINFPDPWPKKRHWKHRLLQKAFLLEMHRALKPSGQFTFVTDDKEYSDVVINEMQNLSCFTPVFAHPFYQTELLHYGSSYFETLWRSKGKEIRYHQWQK